MEDKAFVPKVLDASFLSKVKIKVFDVKGIFLPKGKMQVYFPEVPVVFLNDFLKFFC